jgi:hypothetical protein
MPGGWPRRRVDLPLPRDQSPIAITYVPGGPQTFSKRLSSVAIARCLFE